MKHLPITVLYHLMNQALCSEDLETLYWDSCTNQKHAGKMWNNFRKKEKNVLFNDALNTFYLQLNSVRNMVNDHLAREETYWCHYMGYSFWLAARVILYALFYRQDSTYHGLCYTSHGTLAGMRNSSMGPPWGIDSTTHRTMSGCSTTELNLASTWASFGGGQGGHVPPTFGSEGDRRSDVPSTFWDGKKSRISIFTFSLSTHIQIFWACTVYLGWGETEIRATMTFKTFLVWGLHASQTPPPPPPHTQRVFAYGARS